MNIKDKSNEMSRLKFLKASGLLAAAGFTSLSFPAISKNLSGTFVDHIVTNALGDYQVVIASDADDAEKHAAQELQKYLSKIAPAPLSLVSENEYKGKTGIYIGKTLYLKKQRLDAAKLAGDGYLYRSVGKNLIIAGGGKKGVLYGVYDFLDGLGFKKYSPDEVFVPRGNTLTLKKKDQVFRPMVTYRTTSYSQMGDQEYSDWNKISSKNDWGLFVHTFNTLLSPQEYGKTNPEYFSLINGNRVPGTQLCLSNDKVAEVLSANLKKKIAEKPEAIYWSVSQNDNDQYCRCEPCTALNQKYGNVPSGSILYFVNKIAKNFPDKMISTLAYWYTRKAPTSIKAEQNVNIMLCNIESRRQGPVYETDPAFSQDLKDWGAIAGDILLWDYNIQFTNFFAPFPNLYTIKPNIKFYTDNHVRALYMQSNAEPAAEMALLRAYLICKLMWNPEADEKAIMNDFLMGFYGPGGTFIGQYIDTMHEALVKSGMKLNIFGDPVDAKDGFLSPVMLLEYNRLFDQAEGAVKAEPSLLKRVQAARLPLMYAAIQIGRTEVDTPRSLYEHTTNGLVAARPEMITLVSKFVEGCKRENVKLVRERAGSPEHFLEAYTRIFDNLAALDKMKSYKKKISTVSRPGAKSKDPQGLTDGMFASYEAWQATDPNWIFYTGEHMDFVLDLGSVMPVSMVYMDFLNPQAQPDWHLMALPKYVTYALSVDGKQFAEPVQIDNPHNPNPVENPDISKISIQSFKAEMKPGTKIRFVRVHAENILKAPSWHIRAGQPMSVYSDQIVVS